MSVYVDQAQHHFGNMIMCHMVADSTDELLAMARKIGVAAKWLQKPGTSKEHFDICKTKRALAVKNGAKEISSTQLAEIFRRHRITKPWYYE